MTSPIHVFHNDDLYEFTLHGTKILRIIKYTDKGSRRSEVEFDSLPKPVISDLVEQILAQSQ